jgi:replication factor A1
MVGNQTMSVAFAHSPEINQSHDTSSRNYGSGRFAPTNAPPFYM